MKRRILAILVLLAGIGLLQVGIAGATNIPVEYTIYQPDPGINPSNLTATVEFFNSAPASGLGTGWDMYILVTNTSNDLSPVDFPAPVILTGIGFNLPNGVDIIGGAMSTGTYHTGSESNPSKIWGYDNTVTTGPFAAFPSVFSVNTVISTLAASVDANSTFFLPGGNVDGPDGGIRSSLENAPPASWNYYTSYAWIGLDVTGTPNNGTLANAALAGDVVVAFGSPTAVPEPATMLLLGGGLIGIAAFSRKRLLK